MTIPSAGRRFRYMSLLVGAAIFFWLSFEDVTIVPALILGGALSTLIILLLTFTKLGGKVIAVRYTPLAGIMLGSLIGTGSSAATVALMFFKNARHAHLFPDYPTGMMIAVLKLAPVWAAAGGMLGLALVLIWLALRDRVMIR